MSFISVSSQIHVYFKLGPPLVQVKIGVGRRVNNWPKKYVYFSIYLPKVNENVMLS